MIPIRLTLQAFGPYQETTEICFGELRKKLFLITGATGGGKTTILDGICFALFCRATGGRRTWQDMRNLSAREEAPTLVDFEFSLGTERYRFQRSWRWHRVRGSGRLEMRDEHQCSRKNGESWELLVSGSESKVREYAQNLLGLTCEQFSQVMVLPQGEFRKLLLSNSTEKAKIFQTLFQTEKWEQLTRHAQLLADSLRQQCERVLSIQQGILKNEGIETPEELEALVETVEQAYENTLKQTQKLQNELENRNKIIQKINKLLEAQQEEKRLSEAYEKARQETRLLEENRKKALKRQTDSAPLEKEREALLRDTARQKEQLEAFSKLASQQEEEKEIQKRKKLTRQEGAFWEEKAKTAAQQAEKGRAYLQELHEKLKALPEAAQRAQELKNAFALWKNWEKAKNDQEAGRKAFQEALERYRQTQALLASLQESLERAQQAARENMAGHLAAGLKEGSPCPVCGAVHHPSPAQGVASAISPEEEKRLGMLVKKAQEDFSQAQARFAQAQAKEEMTGKKVEEAEENLRECGVPTWELPKLLAAAQEELAALQKDRDRLPQAEERLKQREEEEKKARKQAEASKEQQGQWENRWAAVKARIDSLKEGLPEDYRVQPADQAEKSLRRELARQEGKLSELQRELQEAREAAGKAAEACAAAHAREKAVRAQLQEAASRREQAQADAPGEYDLKALEEALSIVRKESGEALQKAGSLLEKRQSLEKAEKRLRQLEEESREAQEEYSKAERLARFFSGKNPQNVPLKMYVLGVMLDDILSRANVYFTTLSGGRYQLNRKGEAASRGYSGLDLEIYDAYSGGERNVDTLSGGELFLASLSLAFGLSDVVQSYSGGVRLESIFIDEGFGTLDEETLSTAMKALFEIQKGGRTVGIISHVNELKSRIPAQIQILANHQIKVRIP